MLVAFLVGLPVFFSVGLVLLAPIVFTLAQSTGTPLMRLVIPLTAGLSAAHGLVPPHPGPLAAIERLGADTGTVLVVLARRRPAVRDRGRAALCDAGWAIACGRSRAGSLRSSRGARRASPARVRVDGVRHPAAGGADAGRHGGRA